MKYRYDNFLYEQQAEIEQAEKKCQKEEREREKGGLKTDAAENLKILRGDSTHCETVIKKKEKKKEFTPRNPCHLQFVENATRSKQFAIT